MAEKVYTIFVFATVLSFILKVSADVTIRTAHYHAEFKNIHIVGPYLAEISTVGLNVAICARRCLENAACKSFNYKKDAGGCQLSGSFYNPCIPNIADMTGSTFYTVAQPDPKPQSCADYKNQHRLDTLPDGMYCLFPGTPQTIPIVLFCKEDFTTPGVYKEFVNLKPGSQNTNYFPGNGGYTEKGGTAFSKIRINTTNLKVIGSDFNFAVLYGSTGGTKLHPYGVGGGCSSNGMLYGSFDIDLVGTKFKVREGTTWKVYGYKPKMGTTSISSNWQRVHNKCDGFCGSCYASGGLYLQIYNP